MILPREIKVNYETVETAIGTPIEKEEIHNILRAMEMELKPVDDHSFIAIVPTNKADVLREVDIIEEVLRIYGFNKVPIPAQLKTAITYQNYPTTRQVKNGLADYLANNGFNEMMGMSLIESSRYGEPREDMVFINNTSNIHLDIMRPDALISGLKSVTHNLNYQQNNVRLFEFGRSYVKEEEGFKENEFLSLFVTGTDNPQSWQSTTKPTDFYYLKNWVERVLQKVSIGSFQTKEVEGTDFDFGLEYHRGPNTLVRFGQVSKKLLKRAEISVPVYFAEFGLKALVKGGKKATIQVDEISKYPSMERDLSLVLAGGVTFGEVMAVSKNTNKKLIKEVSLFDVYKNEEQLGKDKKAYAVKFKFQDISKTLTDKEVDKVMTALQENFKKKLSAEIRM